MNNIKGLIFILLFLYALNSFATTLEIDPDGSYYLYGKDHNSAVLHAEIGAQINKQWLFSHEYPKHFITQTEINNDLGKGKQWKITHTGLKNKPDLICTFHYYPELSAADIQVQIQNTLTQPITVQSIRLMNSKNIPQLGPVESNRILSDSFTEDRPSIRILDIKNPPEKNRHRAVGSQLIYNRATQQSLFLGALSSNKLLTIMRLYPDAGYEVDSTGTTEMSRINSLKFSAPEDQIELSLTIAPGKAIDSEKLLMSVGNNYHAQLEQYGELIKKLFNARVSAPTLRGWWSWTSYYFGVNQDAALTNAQWLGQYLKPFGYNFFLLDEGYQFARGEYTTLDATHFQEDLTQFTQQVHGLGLTFGIWVSPFQVSERSWVYQNHKDWLIHKANGEPIRAGYVTQNKEILYALDPTHPDAQKYLHHTYSILAKKWGARLIKLDFMEDTLLEGFYYKPNTTALEAQRIGLKVIRNAVGNNVLLDKDGSPMLNPVGYVDLGRVSSDTCHDFSSTKNSAPGIAARYFMHRNFFVNDPDAFNISKKSLDGSQPISLDEAKASITLAALAGGMLEIGDNLPSLHDDQERLALLKNKDLLALSYLGQAAKPIDLMSFLPEDEQPSIFFLQLTPRQSMLAIFNWTEKNRQHTIDLSQLGLTNPKGYDLIDVLGSGKIFSRDSQKVSIEQPMHSVKLIKIIDHYQPIAVPVLSENIPTLISTGKTATFSVNSLGSPVLSYLWNFGDGISGEGDTIKHTYTLPGKYKIQFIANGIDGAAVRKTFEVNVAGTINTAFMPEKMQRLSLNN